MSDKINSPECIIHIQEDNTERISSLIPLWWSSMNDEEQEAHINYYTYDIPINRKRKRE